MRDTWTLRGSPVRAIGMVLALVLVACAASPRERLEPDRWSIETAEVLFTAQRDGLSDLYVLDRSTGETRRVTGLGTPDGGANAARVSPDGQDLAFQVRHGSNLEIHVRALAGGESRNVTRHLDYDVNPVWSPDGTELAFMSTRGFELGSLGPFPGHLYVHALEADALRQITTAPLTSSLGPSDWSPDGTGILMARAGENGIDVYRLDVRSGVEVRLTDALEDEYSATYSHSGDRIAFHAESDSASQIVVLDLATGERRVVTTGPGSRYSPEWSPDDEWLLFTASDDGARYDIRAVRLADGTVLEIVSTEEDEREGQWLNPRAPASREAGGEARR